MNSEGRTPPLEALELATVLLRHYGIHQGLWTLQVNFNASGHNFVDVRDESVAPGVLIGVRSVCLRQVQTADPLTVDAAAVNPKRA